MPARAPRERRAAAHVSYDIEDDDLGPEDEILDRAWQAIDAGEFENALAALEELDPDWPERWIPEALARLELGDLRRAHALIAHASEIGDENDADLLWARAALALREWRLDEAQTLLDRLAAAEPGAAVYERLSLLADLRGDFAGADALLARAHALAPESALPARLTQEEFDSVVDEAIGLLPDEFQAPIESTEIVVEPVPLEWMIDASDPSGTPPDLLGLFVGASELDDSDVSPEVLPRRIFLFQRNLERSTRTRDELLQEIRVTLFHEIGHMLGFDEAGVAAMGLE